MAKGTREIKRRLKSVGNTRKITKAMEMVAAAKMRKAVDSVLATRDYANLAWATVLNLSERTDQEKHVLLAKRDKVENVALILIGSNRGLCGGFNLQVVQKAIASIKKHEKNIKNTEVITLGGKSRDIIKGLGYNIVADFVKEDLTTNSDEVAPIASMIIKDFITGKYDKVFVAFTDFESSMKQTARVKQLLPIESEPDDYLGVVGKSDGAGVGTRKEFIDEKREKYLIKGKFQYEYIFEPSAEEVLEEMLPRLIEVQVYQAVLESDASEHSARMIAMKNASDAAEDMIDDLTLSFNQARQATITQEIAEISSGAVALGN
ncbi:ATP synthase F1 subunit gamma [Candidatus Kuenenbacteria bacterium]|nr:ATP synthase F1 subunit gamma [Candidatus Kuenenbacteria bacterium]